MLVAFVAAAAIGALVCVAPTLIVLAGFAGLVPFDMSMLFVALPTLGVAVGLAVVGRGALGDLMLPRPVLSADEREVFDRRVMIEPLPWSEVTRAISIVSGGGGVVLDLRNPIPTFGMGSIVFETPDPGIAHIAVRGMSEPADALARALLDLAAQAGAETGEARAHEKMRRRSWSV